MACITKEKQTILMIHSTCKFGSSNIKISEFLLLFLPCVGNYYSATYFICIVCYLFLNLHLVPINVVLSTIYPAKVLLSLFHAVQCGQG
jgi:hypothetical protein